MTAQELAETYIYELHNDADHLLNLVEDAKRAIASGNFVRALETLAIAERPAGMIGMRLSDAIKKTKAAEAERGE